MKISKNCTELVKKFEGLYLNGYKCPAGVPTIGYGHTGKVNGQPITTKTVITKAQAIELLEKDLAVHAKYVENTTKKFVPNQNQFDALVSFSFNVGQGNLKKLLNGRSAKEVAAALSLYNKATVNGKLTVLKGLTRRREAEKALFLKACEEYYKKYYGSSGSITAALAAIGLKDTSFSYRKKIAKKNGYKDYKGTAKQNTELLNLLKNGKLKKA